MTFSSSASDSLHDNDVSHVVVVENGEVGSVPSELNALGIVLVSPGVNLGYGRGVNRGVALAGATTYVLVSNPDVVVHRGAVKALVDYLDEHPNVALVGPTILRPDGTVYPSLRVFPNMWLAGVHALLSPLWPNNPATQHYRSARTDGTVDWVSGAFFLVRRSAFELVGGFDERYFMFAEEMALCWATPRTRLQRGGDQRCCGHPHRRRFTRPRAARHVDSPPPQRTSLRESNGPGLAPHAGASRQRGLERAAPPRTGRAPEGLSAKAVDCSLGCEWSVVESRCQSRAKRPT